MVRGIAESDGYQVQIVRITAYGAPAVTFNIVGVICLGAVRP